jgi:hypothetical protein
VLMTLIGLGLAAGIFVFQRLSRTGPQSLL